MTPTLTLRPNRERSLLRRHPWVFSGAVDSVTGDPAPGDTVIVRSSTGDSLGCAAYSPASQIRARMWSFTDTSIDEMEIVVRVAAAVARRSALGQLTDSCRLVFSEADELPGVIADRYGDVVVCQLTTTGSERWREPIADALAALPGVSCVIERSDGDNRKREGLADRVGPLRGSAPQRELVISEHGLRYAVDVTGGQKTGFYLDQRDSRWLVGVTARAKRVLNVFSYTGSMGVAAARGGAESVCSIDSSAPALEVAKRNAELNAVDVGEVIEGDAFSVLRTLRDRARHFDLILLDPPKLAATEGQLDKASRAYKDLNLLAIKLLAPGGTLLTWSCSGAMSMDLFQRVVAGAALDSRRQARIVGRLHQPLDHPIPLWFPEAEYLKGLILHAD